MTDKPSNCRMRLKAEGKPYPRSGCVVCKNGGLLGCPYEKQAAVLPVQHKHDLVHNISTGVVTCWHCDYVSPAVDTAKENAQWNNQVQRDAIHILHDEGFDIPDDETDPYRLMNLLNHVVVVLKRERTSKLDELVDLAKKLSQASTKAPQPVVDGHMGMALEITKAKEEAKRPVLEDWMYNPLFWQEGKAGGANVVTFDGEDVRPVCWIPDANMRAKVIAKHNETVTAVLARNK